MIAEALTGFATTPAGYVLDGFMREAWRYQVVDFRNTPPDTAKKLGLFFVVDLGGVKMKPSDIY